jgi:hypothetical protein
MRGGGFGAFLTHSNVANYIKDAGFPATKQDLVNMAEDHHAPQNVIKAIEKLPDMEFKTIGEVTEHLQA